MKGWEILQSPPLDPHSMHLIQVPCITNYLFSYVCVFSSLAIVRFLKVGFQSDFSILKKIDRVIQTVQLVGKWDLKKFRASAPFLLWASQTPRGPGSSQCRPWCTDNQGRPHGQNLLLWKFPGKGLRIISRSKSCGNPRGREEWSKTRIPGFTYHSACVKARSYLTLSDSTDCNLPGSSVSAIFQARKSVAIPLSSVSSWPRDWTHISYISHIAGGFFTTKPPGKPPRPQYVSLTCCVILGKSLNLSEAQDHTP